MENNSSQNSVLREHLLESLNRSNLDVEFYKKDGSLRTLYCTLNCDAVHEYFENMTEENLEKERKKNPDVNNVWDLEADAWRAFNINSIISYEVYE